MEIEIIQRLAVATGIGLLVGVERGWREREAGAGMRTAGIRTFALAGLLGGVLAAIATALGDKVAGAIVIGVGFVAFTATFAAFRMRELIHEEHYGFTTVVAAMATNALGAYAVVGDQVVAVAAGVAVTVILAVREALHGWLSRLAWKELRAAIVLAAMTFLALPVIPDQSYGPFGGVNPRQVWLLAVVLAAVSFAGYAAVKRLGAGHGFLVAAAAGGLVSSTAVTVTAARRAAAGEAKNSLLAASAALASAVSFGRTLAVIAALNSAVAIHAAAPLAAAAITAVAVTGVLAWRQLRAPSKSRLQLRNPFSLRETLALALMLGGVLFVARAGAAWFGSAGALTAAVLAGAVDTDSAAYSMAELARGTLPEALAAQGLLLAVTANNLFKLVISAALGGGGYALPAAFAFIVPLAAGAATALLFSA
jgi:uncharacterized membrane protein (DUF4010 family)